jgi:hypothetical protein
LSPGGEGEVVRKIISQRNLSQGGEGEIVRKIMIVFNESTSKVLTQ